MAYMKDSTGRRLDTFEVADVASTLPTPGTRVGAVALTAPNGVGTAGGTALNHTQRTLVKLPFGAARWRMKFRNQSLRSATPYTTPCTITGIWTGAPARETGTSTANRWVGNCTAAPTQVATSLTVPTDGSFVYSPWITADPFQTNVEKVLSWGITSTTAGDGVAGGNSYQGVIVSGSTNAGNQTLSSPSVGTNSIRLDVLVEYEFAESVQHMLLVGDSNTVQYGPAPAGIASSGAGSLPHESWPMVAGAMGGFAVMNLGVGSATMGDFAVNFPAMWSRIPTGALFDAAIVSLGTNGLSTTLEAGFIPHMQTIHTKLRSTYGVATIWWTTITPRAYPDGAYTSGGTKIAGSLTTDAAAGATSLSCTYAPANGTMMVGTGQNQEDVTVSATTGSGPYTVTVSALVNAHYSGERIATGDERTRLRINNFIRNLPDGAVGVFDFEKLLEASPGAYISDARYASSDYLHYTRAVGVPKANMVVAAGVKPLFGAGT